MFDGAFTSSAPPPPLSLSLVATRNSGLLFEHGRLPPCATNDEIVDWDSTLGFASIERGRDARPATVSETEA